MTKTILTTLFIAITVTLAFTQYTTVAYDYQKNYFNEGKPLPAEELILFSGDAKKEIVFVEIELYDSKGVNLLYEANWRSSGGQSFSIPFNYRLYPSEEYDFRINYYRTLPSDQKIAIKEQLMERFQAFIDGNFTRNSDKLELSKSPRQMFNYMNDALNEILLQNRPAIDLPGQMTMLSDAVKNKLKSLNGQDSQSEGNTKELLAELKTQISTEVERIFSRDYVEIADSKYIDDYETIQKRSAITMNLGYGGVYLDGDVDDLSYGASPFIGLAFPLGNNKLSPILGNASITLGIFTDNFEDADGNKVTGFVAPRPIYLGLDYKLFQFIRFNAGAAVMETEIADGLDATKSNLMIRPFVGLGIRLNWNVSIDK